MSSGKMVLMRLLQMGAKYITVTSELRNYYLTCQKISPSAALAACHFLKVRAEYVFICLIDRSNYSGVIFNRPGVAGAVL